jgi:hypothetical protein
MKTLEERKSFSDKEVENLFYYFEDSAYLDYEDVKDACDDGFEDFVSETADALLPGYEFVEIENVFSNSCRAIWHKIDEEN